jgi:hypothetical protein
MTPNEARAEALIPERPVEVTFEQVRRCHFQPKPCALCGLPKANKVHTPKKRATCPGKWPRGCNHCGENKSWQGHFGAPASFNVWSGSGTDNTQAYKGIKDIWQRILATHLQASGLPRGQKRIEAEGVVTFPDSANRDQGNFRVILEKALGDALVDGSEKAEVPGGWLADDNWSAYEFGALRMRVVPGVSATELTVRITTPINEQMEIT